MAFGGEAFGSEIRPIFLDEVSCIGTETELLKCSNDGFGPHDCVQSNYAAAVRCQGGIVHNQHH